MNDIKAKLRNDPENPYNTSRYVWQVVACGYCGVKIGSPCMVKGTDRMAEDSHDVRFDMRRAAYDAWEKGRKHGQAEVIVATEDLHQSFQPKIELTEAV